MKRVIGSKDRIGTTSRSSGRQRNYLRGRLLQAKKLLPLTATKVQQSFPIERQGRTCALQIETTPHSQLEGSYITLRSLPRSVRDLGTWRSR